MTPRPSRLGAACVALGAGALALVAGSCVQRPYELLPVAANASVHRIAVEPGEPWSVQLLADVQDGYLYLPRMMREGEQLGVAAVIIAGDLARGAGGDHLRLPLRQLERHPPSAPLFAVPGNHDTVTVADRERFIRCFGAASFEFSIEKTRFIGLDSTTPMSGPALAGLADRLDDARARGERVVVVRHHSLPGSDELEPDDDPHPSPELVALLARPPVAYVIAGHAHHWDVWSERGVRHVIAPPSGDRSWGEGQTPVSYLILRWTGESFALEHHQFFRSNRVELAATVDHFLYAHLLPSLSRVLGRSVL